MVQPDEQKNAEIMQRRGIEPREPHGAGTGRLPYPGEVIGRSGPPYHPIGVDALSPLLLHVTFPATTEDVLRQIGDARIAVSADRTRTVREVLEHLGPTRFASSLELERAVERAWDRVADLQGRGGRHRQGDDLSGRSRG